MFGLHSDIEQIPDGEHWLASNAGIVSFLWRPLSSGGIREHDFTILTQHNGAHIVLFQIKAQGESTYGIESYRKELWGKIYSRVVVA